MAKSSRKDSQLNPRPQLPVQPQVTAPEAGFQQSPTQPQVVASETAGTPVMPAASNESRPSLPPVSNEELLRMGVPPFLNLPNDVYNKAILVESLKQELTLEQAQTLMAQVKYAQASLTEGLNQLSTYRKTVARVLETRRREQATARKQRAQGAPTLGLPPLPQIPSVDETP